MNAFRTNAIVSVLATAGGADQAAPMSCAGIVSSAMIFFRPILPRVVIREGNLRFEGSSSPDLTSGEQPCGIQNH